MEVNEKVKPEAEENLEDLSVTEDQSEQTKGAGAPSGRIYVATDTGVFVS